MSLLSYNSKFLRMAAAMKAAEQLFASDNKHWNDRAASAVLT